MENENSDQTDLTRNVKISTTELGKRQWSTHNIFPLPKELAGKSVHSCVLPAQNKRNVVCWMKF